MKTLYAKLARAGVTMVRRELEIYGPGSVSAMFPEIFLEPEDVPSLDEIDRLLGCWNDPEGRI